MKKKKEMNGGESDAEKVRFRPAKRDSCQSGTCRPFLQVCVSRKEEECRDGLSWGGFVDFVSVC